MAEIVIHDGNYTQFINPTVNGETKVCGTTPRDYASHPHGCFAFAPAWDALGLPLIPESEWQARLDLMTQSKALLSDVRNISGPTGGAIPSRDQNGKGYCLVPGTKIEMARLQPDKNIEDVRPGDIVVSHMRKQQRVLETMSRLVSEPVIKLFADNTDAMMTGEHPVFTNEHGWLPAWTLKQGMHVLVGHTLTPIRAIERVPYHGPVYNLEVEEDHSYVANGIGVHNCWAHSGVSAHLIARAKMGSPYADLSAYGVACMVKKFQDQGGWGSEGIEFQASKGCPTSAVWPQQSMSHSNDNPKTWENAALHKITGWVELDPKNMKAQFVSALLQGWPVVTDENWWGHSICAVDLVSLNPFRTRIWNSWGDTWSENGMGLLEGSKAMPDAAWAVMLITPGPA